MSVGALDIEVSGNFARFASDMGRVVAIAEATGKRIESSFGAVGEGLRSIAGLVGVGLSIEGFRELITSSIEAKARLFDLQTQLGISVEALGALRNVGKLTGTSIDDIALASGRLSKAVQTQNADSAGAAQAIKALGLNFAQFKALNPDEQLVATAKAMASFADDSGKTAAAMLLFGRTGATLLPFLRDLAANSELTSMQTAEAAKQAKEFEDNLVKLKIAGEEFRDSLLGQMIPALTEFVHQMIEAKTASEKFSAVWDNIRRNLNVDTFGLQVKKVAELNAEVADAGRALSTSIAQSEAIPFGKSLLGPLIAVNRKSLDDLRAQAAAENDILKGMSDRTQVQLPPHPFRASDNYGDHLDNRAKVKGLDSKANEQITEQERFLQMLRKQLETQEHGKDEALRLEAATKHLSGTQLAEATKIISALEEHDVMLRRLKSDTEALDRAEEQRAKVGEIVTGGNELSRALIEQIEPLRLNATEQARLTELRRLDAVTQKALVNATSDTREEILKLSETMRNNLMRSFDELEAAKKAALADPGLGAKRALEAAADEAHALGVQVENGVTNAFKNAEDALVAFATTGKLSFSSLANSIIADLVRMQIKGLLFGGQGSIGSLFGGGNGLAGLFASLFGSGGGGATQMSSSDIGAIFGPEGYGAAGINYVPHDNYRAILHAGERVQTAQERARGESAGSSQPIVLQPTYHFGSNVSPNDVAMAVQIGNAQLKDDLMRSQRRGGWAQG